MDNDTEQHPTGSGTGQHEAPGIVLVPGFWHGAWCWTDVAARLTSSGRRVLAVDMAGHGLFARRPATATARPFDPAAYATEVSPVAGVDLDAAAELLMSQLNAFAAGGSPVVLVGHSFAGAVLNRVVQAAPELVAHAVYLAAMMPASDVPALNYLDSPEQEGDLVAPLVRADPAVVGALRLDLNDPDETYRAGIRAAWYADVDPDLADAAIALLSPDAPLAMAAGSTTLTEDGWGSVPRTYVHCLKDYSFRPALQKRFIREADEAFPKNPTRVVELDSSHSPFLSQPALLTRVIAAVR